MNLFSPVMSSRFEAEHSIRQRNIAKSSNRIGSGSRLNSEPSKDSAAYRISKRLEAESKFSRSSSDNLKNAYILAQQQSDLITYAESVMKRMNTLAYNATDLTTDDFSRQSLNNEFQEHSKTLESLIFDRTFQQQLLDPQAAEFIDKTIIFDDQVSATGANTKKIDISALGAKIGLWWNTQDGSNIRDRIQLKQGDRWFFDSGEYSSSNGGSSRSEIIDGQIVNGDYFEFDIQPNAISYTTAIDNQGDSNSPLAPGYPKVQAPLGDSTIIEIAVNEPGPEGISRSNSTGWSWRLSWETQKIEGPKGISDEHGTLYELAPLGVSTLKGYELTNRSSASEALSRTEQELESLRKQIYTLAKTFSEIRFKSERTEIKNISQQTALSRINDTDLASECTVLAKNLLLQEVITHARIHSRVTADTVMNLIS